LIELIRNKLIALAHLKWIMQFGWAKGHVGKEGNELVDRLAKEAAVEDGPVVHDRMPREVIVRGEKEMDFMCGNGRGRIWGKGAATKGEGGSDQKGRGQ